MTARRTGDHVCRCLYPIIDGGAIAGVDGLNGVPQICLIGGECDQQTGALIKDDDGHLVLWTHHLDKGQGRFLGPFHFVLLLHADRPIDDQHRGDAIVGNGTEIGQRDGLTVFCYLKLLLGQPGDDLT